MPAPLAPEPPATIVDPPALPVEPELSLVPVLAVEPDSPSPPGGSPVTAPPHPPIAAVKTTMTRRRCPG